MEDLIIPDSLGINWFSYSNGGQDIFDSYKFLDHIKDSVKIDTIIIALNPFDFNSFLSGNRFIYNYEDLSYNEKYNEIMKTLQIMKDQKEHIQNIRV